MLLKGCLILYFIPLVALLRFEKPVSEKVWRQRCLRNALVLNDCNWCWCNENFRYTCNARVCGEVDMFGHFNDAIQKINVGMEGHGVWRSTHRPCEPGVHYSKGDLLCVCSEDGTWPNPVCRDTFRVLHQVVVIKNFHKSKKQKCTPARLYLADCNVCFCPPAGRINPHLCTQNVCTHDNRITHSVEKEVDEVYATCAVDQEYKLGCKDCICLRNNRLLCDNCNKDSKCKGRAPGKSFKIDCNICHCDANGTIFCTINPCLPSNEETLVMKYSVPALRHNREFDCEPGKRFKRDCNICYCFEKRGKSKKYACTLKKCHGSDTPDCEIGTTYSKTCKTCQCRFIDGQKMEVCEAHPKCLSKYNRNILRNELVSYKHRCKAGEIYTDNCNTCTCSADGNTLECTDNICKPKEESIMIDVIPVALKTPRCEEGDTSKIDCNYCICLKNGNNICTTMDCNTMIK